MLSEPAEKLPLLLRHKRYDTLAHSVGVKRFAALPEWPPPGRPAYRWKVAGLDIEADAPLCVAPNRVFPLFEDESLLLAGLIDGVVGLRVLDVGTGSGVLALVAASQGALAVGTDVNPLALACAGSNARRNRLHERVAWCAMDLLNGLAPGSFDLVVANPPFLPTPRDVRLFTSSDGRPSGLAVIGPLLRHVRSALRPGGRLLLTAVSLATPETSFVESLAHRAFSGTNDSLLIRDIYGESIPIGLLVDCFRGFAGTGAWRTTLENLGVDRVRYVLVLARREGRVPDTVPLPLVTGGQFSGSWEARLLRYQAWLAVIRRQNQGAHEAQETATRHFHGVQDR